MLTKHYAALELGESLGHTRAALEASRVARQGFVARRALKADDTPGETDALFKLLSQATHTLIAAEKELQRLIGANAVSDRP
jgi:hypothetical protein